MAGFERLRTLACMLCNGHGSAEEQVGARRSIRSGEYRLARISARALCESLFLGWLEMGRYPRHIGALLPDISWTVVDMAGCVQASRCNRDCSCSTQPRRHLVNLKANVEVRIPPHSSQSQLFRTLWLQTTGAALSIIVTPDLIRGPRLRRCNGSRIKSGMTNEDQRASAHYPKADTKKGGPLPDRPFLLHPSAEETLNASRTGSCGGPLPCRTSYARLRGCRGSGSQPP